MNSHQPMTRRDAVILLGYTTLVLNVLQWLLIVAHTIVMERIVKSTGRPDETLTLICQVASLFLWPFVPLMSTVVSEESGTNHIFSPLISLVIRCVGFSMFLQVTPNFLNAVCLAFKSSVSKIPMNWKFQLVFFSQPLLFLSLGFALAFFPAIFDSMRHRIQNADTGAL